MSGILVVDSMFAQMIAQKNFISELFLFPGPYQKVKCTHVLENVPRIYVI
jgi:hypothetical protein